MSKQKLHNNKYHLLRQSYKIIINLQNKHGWAALMLAAYYSADNNAFAATKILIVKKQKLNKLM